MFMPSLGSPIPLMREGSRLGRGLSKETMALDVVALAQTFSFLPLGDRSQQETAVGDEEDGLGDLGGLSVPGDGLVVGTRSAPVAGS